MSVYKIKVNTLEEWEEMMKHQNYDISKSIVNIGMNTGILIIESNLPLI